MNGLARPNQRPLSPHLQIYHFYLTMVMSILHRITGAGLYFGTILVAIWLAAAAFSPSAFATVNWAFGTWLGQLVLFGYTWAFLHHMLGGIRHLVWDTGAALTRGPRNALALATILGSGGLTLLLWAVILLSR
jgi:succinate dehydrogenase / fumarate reductase cytochrome b subunit